MKKKLPVHGETRVIYPFSFKKRYIDGYVIKFERYKLTQKYNSDSNTWYNHRTELDDREKYVSKKEEIKTFGGSY